MTRCRKGSALLVVVGMMAIISISALAFAVYMRYSRASSSYVRRTSAARGLVKAAFVRAVSAIDRAVNDNSHPNLPSSGSNIWLDRMFTGVNSGDLVGENATVTPLTLEALAYMPPNLVNTCRWYSRRSPTATWKTLDYDQARYVYCAMDISDYLDVNRLFADAPRSSAPHTRFSLSYLFDSDGEDGKTYKNGTHKYPGQNTGAWDSWMEEYRKVDEKTREISWGDKVPFISIADFNMALGKRGRIEPFISPFCEFVGESSNMDAFDNTTYASGGSTYADLRRMTFATDGLFPHHETVPGHPDVKARDLNEAENQPFEMEYLKSKDGSLSDSVLGLKVKKSFRDSADGYDRLSGLGCAALRDYLDTDHLPLSLAIPTTERIPMICGIETTMFLDNDPIIKVETDLGNGAEPKVVSSGGGGNTRQVETTLSFTFTTAFASAIGRGNVDVLTVFPFSHADESDTPEFGLDGRLSLFFAEGDATLRPLVSSESVPHLDKFEIEPTSCEPNTGLINVKLQCTDKLGVEGRKYPLDSKTDALKRLRIIMPDAHASLETAFGSDGNEILRVKLRWNQSVDENGVWTPGAAAVIGSIASGEKEYLAGIQEAQCHFPPIKWADNGVCEGVDKNFSQPGRLKDFLVGGESADVSLAGATWLRIIDGKDNKVVDMVPACFEDDRIHLGSGTSEPGMKAIADSYLGTSYPLMLLKTGFKFDFSLKGLLAACGYKGGFKLSPQTVYVSDPRYNHAPEHWYRASGDMSEEGWLAENHSNLGGQDADIFMATSDSGYMQSKYELMFIPRFTNLKNGGGQTGWYEPPLSMRHSIPETFEDTLNKSLVWKTYCPFPEVFQDEYVKDGIRDDYEAFDSLPWTNDGSSFMMTPYSDNLNAFSGVFANTPIDWKRSSTNRVDEAPFYFKMTAKDFNSKYAYNEWTSETRLPWGDVLSIARQYMGLVRREGEPCGNWKQAWQDMGWFGGERTLCGMENEDRGAFWSADKKFLYGFWRDCIDPKQQLYKVFVRAEPMMMGVGDLHKMAPQLGARAVGLFWRSPAKTGVDGGYPHRTRVLFYRQFE